MEPLSTQELNSVLRRINRHSHGNVMVKYETKDLPEDLLLEKAINTSPTEEINTNLHEKAAKIIANCLFNELDLEESEIDKDYDDYEDAFYSATSITIYTSGLVKIVSNQGHLDLYSKTTYTCRLPEEQRNEFLRVASLIYLFRGGDDEFVNEDIFNAYRMALKEEYQLNN